MTDLFDALTLAATVATIGAAVWVGHLADRARRARRTPPVVQAVPPAALAPCGGIGSRGGPAVVITSTHRPWVIVPEGIGGVAVLAEAEAATHPTDATFAGLVLPLDGVGADAQVSSGEPPQCP